MPFTMGTGAPAAVLDASGEAVDAAMFTWPVRARMDIATQGSAPIVDKVNYVKCTYTITDQGRTVFSDTGKIRGRGNSTWTMPKKPWKVKLDHSLPILGMPKSKDWALLANYVDPSRQRNGYVYWMSQFTGLPWAPRSRMMDVWLNGQYQGLYQLTESVEVDNDRVDVDEIEDTDVSGEALTGGYVMEVDVRLEENSEIGWRTRLNIPIVFDTPDGTVQQQYDYMHAHTQAAEDALFAENFLEGGWHQYFDVDSWCDWYLLTEMVANNDAGFGASVKITKKRGDDKLYLGPAWDYDASFGVTFYIAHPTNTWWVRVGATWIARMLEDPAFVARLKERWASFYANLTAAGALNHITVMDAMYADALADDLAKWGTPSAPDARTYLTDRIAWMQNEFSTPAGTTDTTPPGAPTGFAVVSTSATSVTLSWDDQGASNGTGVVGYRVRDAATGYIMAMTRYPYDDGSDSSPFTLTQVTISNLTPATTYNLVLECRDAPGNWSAASEPIAATTTTD